MYANLDFPDKVHYNLGEYTIATTVGMLFLNNYICVSLLRKVFHAKFFAILIFVYVGERRSPVEVSLLLEV